MIKSSSILKSLLILLATIIVSTSFADTSGKAQTKNVTGLRLVWLLMKSQHEVKIINNSLFDKSYIILFSLCVETKACKSIHYEVDLSPGGEWSMDTKLDLFKTFMQSGNYEIEAVTQVNDKILYDAHAIAKIL